MTDRDLLELAAKAAGLPHQWCEQFYSTGKQFADSIRARDKT